MSHDSKIQHKAAFNTESGFAFEDGERVPIVDPEISTDEPQDKELPPLGLDAATLFDLIIPGAKDSQERDLRLLTLAMKYNHPAAPKSKTELAVWLDVPRSSIDKRWERVSQYLQGEIARLWKSHALVDERYSESYSASGNAAG